MKKLALILSAAILTSCQERRKEFPSETNSGPSPVFAYAQGFRIKKLATGVTEIEVSSPWSKAENTFTYALVPREQLKTIAMDRARYDAIVPIPVHRVVVTSTTHIPALEALGLSDRLIGFPGTEYVSSETTRKRIDAGLVQELGQNETLNTELVMALKPELVVGFGIDGQNKAYETLKRAQIPVVYNGDWTEETPLGKSEWIKFFAPFFGLEQKADSIFKHIEKSYLTSKALAKEVKNRPTVLCGAMYRDVWYLPGGSSWAAQFITDANADYLWKDTPETGSLSLSLESVLLHGKEADFWIGPSQFTAYQEMMSSSSHYRGFKAFKNKKIYTFSATKGATGGLLYYELAPQRPDLVLQDLIHIFHPELLPNHELFFFKPLQ